MTGTPVSGVYSTATVTIGGNETPTDFDFESGYAVGIDLNTTYMTLTGNVSNGAHLTGITTSSGGNSVDSLGLFNATATVSGSNIESVTFDLTGGSWTTATEVLALNAAKIDAAGEFEVEGTGNTGYIGEIVPLPTTALLLGSGLLGLALLGLRRRGMAFQI